LNLVYRDLSGATCAFALAGHARVKLGREEGCELVLAEALVSRHHATVEHVQGSFYLRDAGSANGTFLNGLRLSATSAIMLREGDVVEVGSTTFVFSEDPKATPSAARRASDGTETSFELADLLLDGVTAWKARSESDLASWEEAAARVRAGPGPEALERILGVVAVQAAIDGAALFLGVEATGELLLQGTYPSDHAAKRLEPIAARAFAEGSGRLLLPRATDSTPPEGNPEQTMRSPRRLTAAALPFHSPGERRCLGVLAIERFAPRMDRKDLALVSVMADRVARALSPTTAPEIP
jgi:hypothetical protein